MSHSTLSATEAWLCQPLLQLVRRHGGAAILDVLLAGLLITLMALALPMALLQVTTASCLRQPMGRSG